MTPTETLVKAHAAAKRDGLELAMPKASKSLLNGKANAVCAICESPFYAYPKQILRGGGKYCSNLCFGATLKQAEVIRKCRNWGRANIRHIARLHHGFHLFAQLFIGHAEYRHVHHLGVSAAAVRPSIAV